MRGSTLRPLALPRIPEVLCEPPDGVTVARGALRLVVEYDDCHVTYILSYEKPLLQQLGGICRCAENASNIGALTSIYERMGNCPFDSIGC